MPKRMLRDWTDSMQVERLSPQEEVLFTRLIMKADDYGNFFRNPSMVKSLLFPRKNGLRTDDIDRWLTKLESTGMILCYPAKGDSFLHIVNFGQRLDKMSRKFPNEPENADKVNKNIFPEIPGKSTTEEKGTRTEVEPEEKRSNVPIGTLFSDFIKKFNEITSRRFMQTDKVKKQFSARISEGHTTEEMILAIENCLSDPFHKQNPHHLTPEFITRSDKLEKYINYVSSASAHTGQFPNHYDSTFEKKLQAKDLSKYWQHLHNIGMEPKKNHAGVIIDWVVKKKVAV